MSADPARNQSAMLDVLAKTRIAGLTTTARVVVLDCIQVLRLTASADTALEAQMWICNILLKTAGDQLSELKSMMDAKGSIESVHKLIYEDMRVPEIRRTCLSTFSAKLLSARYLLMGSRAGRKRIAADQDTL